jgi:hypothetical protein
MPNIGGNAATIATARYDRLKLTDLSYSFARKWPDQF